MTESSTKNPKEPLPFTIYRNHVEMMGRLVESQCKLGMMMLRAGEKTAAPAAKAVADTAEAMPAMKDFIPSTDDLQVAAKAVSKAMNEAAVRAIAHAAKDDDADNAAVPDQPKRTFKPSISAAKKPVAKKPAAKKPTVSAAAAKKATARKTTRARAAKA